MDLKKTDAINRLYDVYQNLLTPYQKEVFEWYYQEDYSLKEIADLKGVSRNAIFTLLKRVIGNLEAYEEKLHLLKKNNRIFDILDSKASKEEVVAKIKKILE